MRAAVFNEFGGPEVLRVAEVAEPTLKPGGLIVDVRAAGLQPADAKLRSGVEIPGLTVSLPAVLGFEFAGVVREAADDVTEFAVGDAVLGPRGLGCYAERVAVTASRVAAKPAGMSWAAAGSITGSGQTAHTMVEELAVGPGEVFLVHAAAGGVGSIAAQLAVAADATVIGTASERHHGWLRELGVHPVTYGEGLTDRVRALAPAGVDATLDAVGGEALDVSLAVTKDRQRIITIVDEQRAPELGVRFATGRSSMARLSDLLRLWEAGRLKVRVRRRYPMEEAAAAHRELEAGHGGGKLVLDLALPADTEPVAGE